MISNPVMTRSEFLSKFNTSAELTFGEIVYDNYLQVIYNAIEESLNTNQEAIEQQINEMYLHINKQIHECVSVTKEVAAFWEQSMISSKAMNKVEVDKFLEDLGDNNKDKTFLFFNGLFNYLVTMLESMTEKYMAAEERIKALMSEKLNRQEEERRMNEFNTIMATQELENLELE